MKKEFAILICIIIVTSMGCGNTYKDVRNAAQKDIDIFSEGNMEEINKLIFGKKEVIVDKEREEPYRNGDYGSILSNIFTHSSMSIKKVGRDSIEFIIIAPNMENVFKYMPDNEYALREDGFIEYIKDYVETVEQQKASVSVSYSIEEENIAIDYYNEAFINAITGGLLDAYKELCADMLKAYQKREE